MEEQIRSILAQVTAKTHKIQQLLLLGLSHREIADLVTNGNRGFVYNVYKKFRDSGALGNLQAGNVPNQVLDYSFNRRFGVEIEAYNCTPRGLPGNYRKQGFGSVSRATTMKLALIGN